MPFFRNHHNIEIYYEVINNETELPPLVFVHGYGSSFSMFQYQITILKKYFKLILFDTEGHGKSQKSHEEIQDHLIEETIQDLDYLLELIDVNGEFGIIGHSLLGSNIALHYTIKNPSRVKFLIILNGGLLELDSTIRNIFWNLLPQITRMNFYEIAHTSLPILIERTTPFIQYAITSPTTDDSANNVALDEKIHDDIESMVDEFQDPSSIGCPTLIIGAELDNFAPIYLSKVLRKNIPDSELNIVSMAGHFGPSQQYKEYNRIILQFLKKHKFMEETTNVTKI